MTPRAALAVLMKDDAPDGRDQYELTRAEAIEAIALALGFSEEADIARGIAESIIAKDEKQLRLFRLLGGITQ